jgi:hypothetical protein
VMRVPEGKLLAAMRCTEQHADDDWQCHWTICRNLQLRTKYRNV